jgi:hypothetical protein
MMSNLPEWHTLFMTPNEHEDTTAEAQDYQEWWEKLLADPKTRVVEVRSHTPAEITNVPTT